MKTIKIILLMLIIGSVSKAQIPSEFDTFVKVEPPSIFIERDFLGKAATATFQVTYESELENEVFPTEAIIAFDYAVGIWSHLISSH